MLILDLLLLDSISVPDHILLTCVFDIVLVHGVIMGNYLFQLLDLDLLEVILLTLSLVANIPNLIFFETLLDLLVIRQLSIALNLDGLEIFVSSLLKLLTAFRFQHL